MPALIDINFSIVAPLLALTLGALIVLILDLVLPYTTGLRKMWFAAAIGGIFLSGYYSFALVGPVREAATTLVLASAHSVQALTGFMGTFTVDKFSLALNGIILLTALITIVLSYYRSEEDISGYLALVMFASVGMMVLVGATSLMTVFLGIELLSLSLYVMVAFAKKDERAKEAALKYFILGSVAAAFMVYGFAFLYGAVGSVSLIDLRSFVDAGGTSSVFFKIGLGLTFVGFAFKMALYPFHNWAPDVYEGAPTPVTAFMAVGTKAAIFAGLVRFVTLALPTENMGAFLLPLYVIAGLSMFAGSVGTVAQRNLKRLLAYSGIAHAGYLILALPGLSGAGVGAGVYYLFTYLFVNMGAFAVILKVASEEGVEANLDTLRGLYYRRPLLGLAIALFFLALVGMPGTGVFVGKLLLITNGLAVGQFGAYVMVFFLVLTTGISAYAYLGVLRSVFRRVESGEDAALAEVAATTDLVATDMGISRSYGLVTTFVIAISVAFTIQMGMMPQMWLNMVSNLLP